MKKIYKIIYNKRVIKFFQTVDLKYAISIRNKLNLIAIWEIIWLDIKILEPKKYNFYRLRVWDYRIIYEKDDDRLIILVIKIWSRWDIYK